MVSFAMGDELLSELALPSKFRRWYSVFLLFMSATVEGLMELMGDKKTEEYLNP